MRGETTGRVDFVGRSVELLTVAKPLGDGRTGDGGTPIVVRREPALTETTDAGTLTVLACPIFKLIRPTSSFGLNVEKPFV